MTKRKISDYETGYGKPPVKHQFKPGQSGNPSGKGKGKKAKQGDLPADPSITYLPQLIASILAEPVSMTRGGKTVRMNTAEAIVRKLLAELVSAPIHHKTLGLRMLKELGVFDLQKVEPEEDDDDAPLYTEEERRLLMIARAGLGPEEGDRPREW